MTEPVDASALDSGQEKAVWKRLIAQRLEVLQTVFV